MANDSKVTTTSAPLGAQIPNKPVGAVRSPMPPSKEKPAAVPGKKTKEELRGLPKLPPKIKK